MFSILTVKMTDTKSMRRDDAVGQLNQFDTSALTKINIIFLLTFNLISVTGGTSHSSVIQKNDAIFF